MNLRNSWSNTSHEIEKISHTWTIENFDVLFDFNAYRGLTSSKFPNSGSDFQFSLQLSELDRAIYVTIKAFAINLNHKCKVETWVQGISEDHRNKYFSMKDDSLLYLMSLESFRKERNSILVNGGFIIRCVITVLKNMSEQQGNSGKISCPQLFEDFSVLLETEDFPM